MTREAKRCFDVFSVTPYICFNIIVSGFYDLSLQGAAKNWTPKVFCFFLSNRSEF